MENQLVLLTNDREKSEIDVLILSSITNPKLQSIYGQHLHYQLRHLDLHQGLVVITTAQLHSEFRFSIGSNPAHGVSGICDDENLWQLSRLEIRLKVLRRSTITQKASSSHKWTMPRNKASIFCCQQREFIWEIQDQQVPGGNRWYFLEFHR